MEIWIPLISACVGGLIATVPVLIGLGIQIYIHVGERQQKEREAKIQTKEKWIERDILRIMNGVEKVINLLMTYVSLRIDKGFEESEDKWDDLLRNAGKFISAPK